jgi:hypothetical protein
VLFSGFPFEWVMAYNNLPCTTVQAVILIARKRLPISRFLQIFLISPKVHQLFTGFTAVIINTPDWGLGSDGAADESASEVDRAFETSCPNCSNLILKWRVNS